MDPAVTVEDAPGLMRILARDRTVAVVGLSASWHRPSFFAAKYLQSKGYRIVPVNPRYAGETILGETVYASLEDIPHAVDMVDVFRRSEHVAPIAESAIAIGARTLWQQLGVNNTEAAQRAAHAGLDAVVNRCTKIEHARLFGGLHWAGVNTGVLSGSKRPRA